MADGQFTQAEVEYLKSQPLGRLATVAADGQPDAAPVGFEFDGHYFYIGGRSLPGTRKYKNIAGGQNKVAFVVDDMVSTNPWRPRGLRVYGTAEIVQHTGRLGAGDYLRITPLVSWSWALNPAGSERYAPDKTVHVQA